MKGCKKIFIELCYLLGPTTNLRINVNPLVVEQNDTRDFFR